MDVEDYKKAKESTKIPSLTTSQFDSYLFPGWKPPTYASYHEFHITRIESYVPHLRIPVLPHRRGVNFFIYLTNGKAVRSKGLTPYEIRPDYFYFLPADQITAIDFVSDDVRGYYCHFSNTIFKEPLLNVNLERDFPFFGFTANPLLRIKDSKPILRLLDILEIEYRSEEGEQNKLIPLYLTTLLAEALKQGEQEFQPLRNKAAYTITEKYKTALQHYIYDKKKVASYAEHLSISKNHLQKCVKSVTGKSAHQLLSEMRILEAKVLLKQTSLSIGEIAFNLGKADQSDFTRFFKSHVGLTPKVYRELKN